MKDTLDLSEEGPQLPDQYTDRAFHKWVGRREGEREEDGKEEGGSEEGGREGGREGGVQEVSIRRHKRSIFYSRT